MLDRISVRILQLGAVAVVLAATVHRAFDLDRFLIPKELVLHLTACLAAVFAIRALRMVELTNVDKLLVAYLVLSALSVVFGTNHWLALRAFAISVSSVLLFWTARALPRKPVVNALALAVIAAAVTSLLQAYGIWLDLFSHNRAPGGTLGNRNFVAHAAAFGMPVVLLAASRGNWPAMLGVPVVTAALVLTRSRAAWLAFAAALVVVVVTRAMPWRKLALALLLMAGGALAALVIPNELHWRSDNPYLESVQGVVNYQEGSGRGRLIQYRRSLLMALRHPVFGVGPGNWAVEYPAHAPADDPSIDTSEAGMTFNPWPSSDWVAFIAERGLVAALALGFAFVLLALRGLRESPMLLATIAGAIVAGAFDAVLLLPLPAFIVFAALGTLSPLPAERGEGQGEGPPPRSLAPLALTLAVVALLASLRSAGQIAAMELYARGGRDALRVAAKLDPGNYRVRLRLARGRNGCEHALAARALFPHAAAARSAARGCD